MGGLVNQAVKGLAKEMQKTAAETRSVSETAALRIQQSRRIQQRLGTVSVGPAMSQSMSTSNINGRVSKNINLLLPVFGAGGMPVAQAQVTQVEVAGRVDSCRVAVSPVLGICRQEVLSIETGHVQQCRLLVVGRPVLTWTVHLQSAGRQLGKQLESHNQHFTAAAYVLPCLRFLPGAHARR